MSCTLEDGKLLVYDVAKDLQKPVIQAVPPVGSGTELKGIKSKVLRTHERCSDYYVVLGFGDGELHVLDLRRPSSM